MLLFSCGEADHSSRDKWVLSSFFLLSSHEVQKKVQTVQTNIVVYVIWAINFKYDVRCDLRGCLEAIGASKPHFFVGLQLMEVLNLLLTMNKFLQKSSRKSPKILINLSKIKFSNSFHVSRNSLRSEPCLGPICIPALLLFLIFHQSRRSWAIIGISQTECSRGAEAYIWLLASVH